MALFGEKYGDKVRVVSVGRASAANCAAARMSAAPATSASARWSTRAASPPASAVSRPSPARRVVFRAASEAQPRQDARNEPNSSSKSKTDRSKTRRWRSRSISSNQACPFAGRRRLEASARTAKRRQSAGRRASTASTVAIARARRFPAKQMEDRHRRARDRRRFERRPSSPR